MKIKLICIKDYFYPTGAHPYQKGTIYKAFKSFNGYWIWTETCPGASVHNFYAEMLEKHFMILSEWREKQINEILN